MNREPSNQEKAMLAAAMLAAHYIAGAVTAEVDRAEINGVLGDVARNSGVSEILVTNETGRIEYGSRELDFVFPSDPAAQNQAAPFTALLRGTEAVVIQDPQPRAIDSAVFQYVGVCGVDRPRIVQVGIAARD